MPIETKSTVKLKTLDPRLVGVIMKAAARIPFTVSVTQTSRTIEQQRAYFKAGNSKVDPDRYDTLPELYKAAKHVTGPGMPLARAIDLSIVGKEPYHIPTLCYFAGAVRSAAEELCVPVRWGGDFDRDGILLEAGTFHDLPHFELDI